MLAIDRDCLPKLVGERATMRAAIVLSFILVARCIALGSDVYRYEVKPGSDLEKELRYTLSVQDKNDEDRSLGMDAVVPIEGRAPDYSVRFRSTAAGKLKDLFELDLTLNDAKGRCSAFLWQSDRNGIKKTKSMFGFPSRRS